MENLMHGHVEANDFAFLPQDLHSWINLLLRRNDDIPCCNTKVLTYGCTILLYLFDSLKLEKQFASFLFYLRFLFYFYVSRKDTYVNIFVGEGRTNNYQLAD